MKASAPGASRRNMTQLPPSRYGAGSSQLPDLNTKSPVATAAFGLFAAFQHGLPNAERVQLSCRRHCDCIEAPPCPAQQVLKFDKNT